MRRSSGSGPRARNQTWCAGGFVFRIERIDGPEFDGPLAGIERAHVLRNLLLHRPDQLQLAGQVVRARHGRHLGLVLGPLLRFLEGRRHVEDGPPVLDGHDAAGGKAVAVTQAVDLVDDGCTHVPRRNKIAVHRVGRAIIVDRALGGHERLGERLPPVHTARPDVDAAAPEDVVLDVFGVEEVV